VAAVVGLKPFDQAALLQPGDRAAERSGAELVPRPKPAMRPRSPPSARHPSQRRRPFEV